MTPHESRIDADEQLKMGLTPEHEIKLRQYGELNIVPTKIFRSPFEHLNQLPTVILQDYDAVMNFQGVLATTTDPVMYPRLDNLWHRIEISASESKYDIFDALFYFSGLIEEVREFRRLLVRVDARYRQIASRLIGQEQYTFTSHVPQLMEEDYRFIVQRDQEYNASWMKRGGVGAFMMLARKWDRFQPMVIAHQGDVLRMLGAKPDRIDDVQDLRRYLALVEAEWIRHSPQPS